MLLLSLSSLVRRASPALVVLSVIVPDVARADAPGLAPLPAPSAAPAQPAPAQPAPAQPAPAQPAPTEATAEPQKEGAEAETRSVYVGFSPLHLILPVFEVTAEVKVHRSIGVSVIGGYGSVRGVGTPRFKVWELGGQAVGYVFGHFDHGMQLGVELLYVNISGEDGSGSAKITGTGTGLAIGPLVGYKLATKVGFTFNVQGGVQYVAARARAENTSGTAATAEDSDVIPLINANVGWSF